MRNRSLSPRFGSSQASNHKRKSLTRSVTRRPMSSNDSQGTYDKLLKTTFIMSSIKKTIKQNDLKYLIGEKRQKLRTEPSGDREWAEKACHKTLIDIRRRYDAIKRQRMTKLNKTENLKQRVKTYSCEEIQWKEKIKGGKEHSKQSEMLVTNNKLEVELKLTDQKVLQHMRDRLKSDIEYYQAQSITRSRQLTKSKQSIRSLGKQFQKLAGETQNAANLLSKLTCKFEEQERERVQHIANLNQMIKEKLLKEQNEQSRLQYEEEEAEKALLAKNEEQQSWALLLLAHSFLKKLLISKMRKEMDKFGAVEECFKNIKSRTTIKDASELVDSFLNRNRTYGELLSEVAKAKDRQILLKQEQAMLLIENAKLQEKRIELLNMEYASLAKTDSLMVNPRGSSCGEGEKYTSATKIKVKEWLLRQLMKISRLDKKRYEYSHNFTKESIQALIMRYLGYLNDVSSREEFSLEEHEDKNRESEELQMENKSFISTYPKTKFSLDMKNSKVLAGEQSNLNKQKAKEQPQQYKAEEQLAVVELQRQEVLQGNFKFMRDLRTKYRQSRQGRA